MGSNGFKKHGGGKSAPSEREIEELVGKTLHILNDDEAQNKLTGFCETPFFQLRDNPAEGLVDLRGYGSTENPIRVNGALGELAYLSKLLTEDGQPLIFHRLGSMPATPNILDIYELVSIDGKLWQFLAMDFYHTRKSSHAPQGFHFVKACIGLNGIDKFLPSFPAGIQKAAMDCALAMTGLPCANPLIRDVDTSGFTPPPEHVKLREKIRGKLAAVSVQGS